MMKKGFMKKAAAIFMATAMVASLSACGGKEEAPAEDVAEETTEDAAEEESGDVTDLTIGFAQSGNPNPWMVALTESMQDQADKIGYNYIYTDANDDMATHVANIEDMLEQDLDYLVIAPIEDTGLESVLASAKEKGVPVITTGRTTTGEYVTTVYSDQAWEGERAAEIIGEHKADAKVVELRGIEGTSSVSGREEGFRKIMAESFPDMEIIAEQTCNFSRQEAMDAMTNVIQANGADAIDAVFCHNDDMALGALQAIKDAGLTPGKDIVVVGIDGQKEAWEAVKSGEMLGSVQCSPKHGPFIWECIEKLEAGETLEAETIVPDKVIVTDTLEETADLVF